jgi:glutathione S-transferase
LAAEGFIHLCGVDQVVACGNALFAGQPDLVLLCVAVHRLEAPLRYATSDGESFPHLYGALNPDAVVAVVPFVEEADGFAVPAGVPGLGS